MEPGQSNVVLLPKTVDYYQIELTRLLETEQYAKAASVLRFLLGCRSDDPRLHEEWGALLEWLETSMLGTVQQRQVRSAEKDQEEAEDAELSEAVLHRQEIQRQAMADPGYADRLMTMLRSGSPDKQLLALEQLSYIGEHEIMEELLLWIQQVKLLPVVQFKALQTLRQLGGSGTLRLPKFEGMIEVEIEETPLHEQDYPLMLSKVMERIQSVSESSQPTLAYFALETWKDFLIFIYGTELYYRMSAQTEQETDIWAGAFHLVLQQSVFGTAEEQELQDMYGVAGSSILWEQAVGVMRSFARQQLMSFPGFE
ncbi:hypothetical protein [Paenibacillus sp. y28]|uniref:hypothetical protein n=1 Tax=Paenibacillus sp. y28 TaxID=3129110 RepID=UPI003018DF0D